MKIAIAGYGVEGRVNYSYFSGAYPDAEVVIVDERAETSDMPEGAKSMLGEGVFNDLDGFDLVVRTAGLAPRKLKTSGKIWSATNEFFAKCPAKIIGVTGTKGKGTTSSLIASILQAGGRTVHLVGNIGIPALELLPDIRPDDIVVYELSSFQLWDIEKSPDIAVVLMIEPDHLEVHSDMDEYVMAKANIAKYQSVDDMLVYHPTNRYSAKIASTSKAQKIRYGSDDKGAVRVEMNKFFVQDNAISSVDTLDIAGPHNLENACAAITVAKLLGISDEAVEQGLADFKGLEHRLQFVAEAGGVRYYDDSIATTPGSAIAAIRSFDQPKTLILGGHDKGADYSELAKIIAQSDSTRHVILIGSNAGSLEGILDKAGASQKVINKGMISMRDVVDQARRLTREGDVVILSPAAASFDQYKSYHDRGEQFSQAVKEIK